MKTHVDFINLLFYEPCIHVFWYTCCDICTTCIPYFTISNASYIHWSVYMITYKMSFNMQKRLKTEQRTTCKHTNTELNCNTENNRRSLSITYLVTAVFLLTFKMHVYPVIKYTHKLAYKQTLHKMLTVQFIV